MTKREIAVDSLAVVGAGIMLVGLARLSLAVACIVGGIGLVAIAVLLHRSTGSA